MSIRAASLLGGADHSLEPLAIGVEQGDARDQHAQGQTCQLCQTVELLFGICVQNGVEIPRLAQPACASDHRTTKAFTSEQSGPVHTLALDLTTAAAKAQGLERRVVKAQGAKEDAIDRATRALEPLLVEREKIAALVKVHIADAGKRL